MFVFILAVGLSLSILFSRHIKSGILSGLDKIGYYSIERKLRRDGIYLREEFYPRAVIEVNSLPDLIRYIQDKNLRHISFLLSDNISQKEIVSFLYQGARHIAVLLDFKLVGRPDGSIERFLTIGDRDVLRPLRVEASYGKVLLDIYIPNVKESLSLPSASQYLLLENETRQGVAAAAYFILSAEGRLTQFDIVLPRQEYYELRIGNIITLIPVSPYDNDNTSRERDWQAWMQTLKKSVPQMKDVDSLVLISPEGRKVIIRENLKLGGFFGEVAPSLKKSETPQKKISWGGKDGGSSSPVYSNKLPFQEFVLFLGVSFLLLGITQGDVLLSALGTAIFAYFTFSLREKTEKIKELTKEAYTDPLTGLPNQRAFVGDLKAMIERNEPFALLLIDVDRFKAINDTYGHEKGDEIIGKVADILLGLASRWSGVKLYRRYSGDEFAVILDLASEQDVKVLAEEMRRVVDEKA
ncbi:MAG: GGDEF domain-containing protein, partial [Candidatus Omnitrophota bacterium]